MGVDLVSCFMFAILPDFFELSFVESIDPFEVGPALLVAVEPGPDSLVVELVGGRALGSDTDVHGNVSRARVLNTVDNDRGVPSGDPPAKFDQVPLLVLEFFSGGGKEMQG